MTMIDLQSMDTKPTNAFSSPTHTSLDSCSAQSALAAGSLYEPVAALPAATWLKRSPWFAWETTAITITTSKLPAKRYTSISLPVRWVPRGALLRSSAARTMVCVRRLLGLVSLVVLVARAKPNGAGCTVCRGMSRQPRRTVDSWYRCTNCMCAPAATANVTLA